MKRSADSGARKPVRAVGAPASVRVLGVRVDAVDTAGVMSAVEGAVRAQSRVAFPNVNVHAISIAQHDERFRRLLDAAPLVYCDGMGVRLAAAMLGVKLPPCTVMTWWLHDLAAWCAVKGFSLYLLGGVEGVAAAAAEKLRKASPGLGIAGARHGYFAKSGPESVRVVDDINASGADILVVCFGMPLQEHWYEEHRDRLAVPVTLFGGAALDYAAGEKSPGPRWLAPAGVTWLYRLAREPRRLWKRYLVGNPLFMIRVVAQLLREGRQR